MEVVKQISSEDVVLEEEHDRGRKLLILVGDPCLRDTCGALADKFNCDLYSTQYVENIEDILKEFRPRSIVIDLGLFQERDIKLLEVLLHAEPPLNVLFLGGKDEELANAAHTLATSIGLNVKGKLHTPISVDRLEQELKDMV